MFSPELTSEAIERDLLEDALRDLMIDSPKKLIKLLKKHENKPLVFNRACSVVADYPMPNLWAGLFDPNQPNPEQPRSPEQIKSDVAEFYQKLEGFSHWYQYETQETELRFPDNHETLKAFQKYLRCFDLKYYERVLCANLRPEAGQEPRLQLDNGKMVYRYYQYCKQSGVTPPKPITFQDLRKAFEEETFDQDRIKVLFKKLSPNNKTIALQWASYAYSKEESTEKPNRFMALLDLLYKNSTYAYKEEGDKNLIDLTDYEYACQNIDKDLIEAIENGNLEKIAELITHGVQLNAANGHNTPLTIAVKTGNVEVVQLLIQQGADVNPYTFDYTPLMWAIASNHPNSLRLVEILLENHAEVNPKYREEGSTPLQLALTERKTAIAKLLVLKGANVNVRGTGFDSPLELAIETQDPELITLIFHRTATISDATGQLLVDRAGRLLLEPSITTGDEKLFRVLIRYNPDILIQHNGLIDRLINNNQVHKNLKRHLCHFDNPETFLYYLKHHENRENRALFDRAWAIVSGSSRPRMWARLFDPNTPDPKRQRTQETIDSKAKQFYERLQGFSDWHETTHNIHLRPHQERWQDFRTYLKGYEKEEAMMLPLTAAESNFRALPPELKSLIAEPLMAEKPEIRMAHLYHQFPAQRAREAEAQRKTDRELRAAAAERRMNKK